MSIVQELPLADLLFMAYETQFDRRFSDSGLP